MRAALVLVVVVLSACAPKDDTKKAEAEVDRFHQRWNQWDFTGVYNDAHKNFRAAQNPQTTISQLQSSRKLYGAFKSAKTRGMEITFEHSEKDIVLKYDCVYEHGAAAEAFSYRMTAGKPLLVSYYILSPERAARFDAEEAKRKAQK